MTAKLVQIWPPQKNRKLPLRSAVMRIRTHCNMILEIYDRHEDGPDLETAVKALWWQIIKETRRG